MEETPRDRTFHPGAIFPDNKFRIRVIQQASDPKEQQVTNAHHFRKRVGLDFEIFLIIKKFNMQLYEEMPENESIRYHND
jgi:hypothetical protein